MDEKPDLGSLEKLLETLVCPKCGKNVILSKSDKLICNNCRLIYDIIEDVPIMLTEEATTF